MTGFLNRPQADVALLQRAGSSLDRALFPLLVRASVAQQVTVGELADTVGRHHSTVSRQVSALERQGLVRRAPDPHDGRHTIVQVTEEGRAEAQRIATARHAGMAAVFAGWSPRDRADLGRLVTRLVDSLEASLAEPAR